MEANRSVDSHGGWPKLLPIRSGSDFNWKVFFLGHAGKTPGVTEVLLKTVPENETAAAQAKRLKDDAANNAIALLMLYEVSQSDPIASGVATAQAAIEENPSSHNLFKLLEPRFTQRSNMRLQKLLQEFNTVKVQAGDSTSMICDRYTNLKQRRFWPLTQLICRPNSRVKEFY